LSDHVIEGVRPATAEAPGGQRWLAAAWRQFRLERRMFWRNPGSAFFNFFLPLLLLALFGAIFSGERAKLDVIVPGIAGMCVMSATFTALAYNVTLLRERGILKRLRGTPLPSSAYFAAVAAHAVVNTVLEVGIVLVVGHLVFGIGWPGDWASLLVFVAVGVVAFAALGVALAHAIPNFESAPAYVNAVFLPMVMIAGVFYDEKTAPAVLRDVAQVLPLKHLIDGMSGAIVRGQGVTHHVVALLVLAAWGAVGGVLAVRGFSWEARRH
jgi:ABC-2 type transport system permease protein